MIDFPPTSAMTSSKPPYEVAFMILPTDTRFYGAEQFEELCSRCGQAIDDDTVPIMAWPEDGEYLYRFHPECLGFE